MNRRQWEYAVKLAEVRSFSQLSHELNITQPALSKQIGALEQELGVKLFDRSVTPLTLTPAGAYFIEEAKHLVYEEDRLLRTLEQFKSGEAGRLTIGVSPFRCMYLMPKIVKAIRDKFPHVQIVLHEDDSTALRRDMADGKFDLAILNLPVDESVLDAIPMEDEPLVLAVPNEMAESLPSTENEIDLADCKDLPFVVVAKGQEMRELFDKVCVAKGFQPHIAAEVAGGITSACALACGGIGATLLPLLLANEEAALHNVTLFTVKDCAYIRRPAVVTRHGQYLSDYAKYAIQLLTT
ncbi:MAG: LysR family transcriptional regulator [Clostridia bacterium]|nr:LysR family transcriptional regulator [Clostridia bacterium]